MGVAEDVVVAADAHADVFDVGMRYRPQRLTVQWHITGRCNLRCHHCYQDSYTHAGQDLKTLQAIATQVFALHEEWEESGARVPLSFTITGGEPCVHPAFRELLCFLSAHPSKPALGILSNGSLIDTGLAQFFSRLPVAYVQLSVDGKPATHDSIRGQGHFEQVIQASQILRQADIRVVWSFTAHQGNFHEFADVVRLARKYKVSRIWSDRMIPSGGDNGLKALNAKQTSQYLMHMRQAWGETSRPRHNVTEVALHRALQFQAQGNGPYHCKAGGELVTIMPDGTLYPCRRLPVSVGNVLHTSLKTLYDMPLMQDLRGFEGPQSCNPCVYKSLCKGGLRCLAHAVNGDMFSADPGCQALKGYFTDNGATDCEHIT